MDNVFKTLTHMQRESIDTVSYSMTLANQNSGCLLTSLKGAIP